MSAGEGTMVEVAELAERLARLEAPGQLEALAVAEQAHAAAVAVAETGRRAAQREHTLKEYELGRARDEIARWRPAVEALEPEAAATRVKVDEAVAALAALEPAGRRLAARRVVLEALIARGPS